MWIVASVKNLNIFKYEIEKKFSNVEIYFPKIIKSNKKVNLLGQYIFCFSKDFKKENVLFNSLQFTKGLKKLIFSGEYFQSEVKNFINYCKLHEDTKGVIQNTFFKNLLKEKGKIMNGPLNKYIFSLIKKSPKKISVFIGDIKVSISDKSQIFYSSV
tara:strand:+ start:181 stop:651 length:471 start_codon:yes stop_codon:yes gene_type:complete